MSPNLRTIPSQRGPDEELNASGCLKPDSGYCGGLFIILIYIYIYMALGFRASFHKLGGSNKNIYAPNP